MAFIAGVGSRLPCWWCLWHLARAARDSFKITIKRASLRPFVNPVQFDAKRRHLLLAWVVTTVAGLMTVAHCFRINTRRRSKVQSAVIAVCIAAMLTTPVALSPSAALVAPPERRAAAAQSPVAPTAFEWFNGVSCTATWTCVAVGLTSTSGVNYPGIWRGDGITWSPDVVPALANGELTDVDCASPTMCVAVGYVTPSRSATLALHWDGNEWTRIATPTRGIGSLFTKVACPTTTFCAASGSFNTIDQVSHPYLATWNGTRWRTPTIPVINGRINDLDCASATRCLAVGFVEGTTVIEAPLALDFATTVTVVSPPPLPVSSFLSTVDCVDFTTCYAIGDTYVATPSSHVLLSSFARWTGTAWQPMQTPTLHLNGRVSTDLECSTVNSCWLLGEQTYGGSNALSVPFYGEFEATSGTNGGWTDQPVTQPSLTSGSQLRDMECRSGRCLMVGLVGSGTYSSIESSGVPTAPLHPTVSTASNWMTVAWANTSVSIAGPITEYRVISSNIANSQVTVPANLRRATVPLLQSGTTFSVAVIACNIRGCGVSADIQYATAPATNTNLDVTTTWDTTEIGRLHQSAAYFGLTVPDLQQASVGALAYLIGLVAPAGITPAQIPAVDDQSETHIATWAPTEQSILRDMAAQFALTPTEIQKVATQLIGFLLSLSGH